jgi:hypothetical protein
MKEAALTKLSADIQTEKNQSIIDRPFLSEGDVLSAFLTRIAVTNEGPTSTRQIGILNAFNLRPSLASTSLPPAAGVCLSNAVFTVSALANVSDILTKPLGHTALLVRKSITEQSTRPQVEALAALTRTAVEQTGRPPVFGDGGTRLVIFSNWTKAGFFKLDFGAALVGEGHATQVKPSFVNLAGVSNGLSPRGSWPILGQDENGGYWIQGNLRTDLWPEVEKKLEEMTAQSVA